MMSLFGDNDEVDLLRKRSQEFEQLMLMRSQGNAGRLCCDWLCCAVLCCDWLC